MKLVALVAVMFALVACDKPSEEECTKAIENMQRILGTEGGDIRAQVRRCKGGSSKKAVQCATAAKDRKELLACDMIKFDDAPAPSGSAQ